ncbi:MAG: cold shock domain-containing protein [Marinifilaceae bacterium]|jgi:CspA family cold shock protein|nr:cold shock domain-containing protein [Marinifilaceae bacterium]
MPTGKIKFYNKEKGFGFIIENETASDIFFHCTGLNNRENVPSENDLVSYETVQGKKEGQLKAIKIEITGEAESNHDNARSVYTNSEVSV